MRRFDYRLIRQMLLLAAVAHHGSIARAARALAISPSPVIAQINELEARLGIKFLERTPQGVSLTVEGRAFLPNIERLIGQAEALDCSVRMARQGTRGVLRLGGYFQAMFDVIPDFVDRHAAAYPDIAVFVEEIDSPQAEEKLVTQELDLVIVRWAQFKLEDIASRRLGTERFSLIVPSSHRLAGATSPVPLIELKDEPWIVVGKEANADYHLRTLAILTNFTPSPRIRHEVHSVARQIAFVACRQGIALIPNGFTKTLPASVTPVETEPIPPNIPIALAWKKTAQSGIVARAAEILAEAAKKYLPA